jgi:hypothetical protein
MSDKAYDNALRRKQELQRELKEVEDFLRLYRQFAEGQKENVSEPTRARVDAKGAVSDPYVNPSRNEVGKYAKELMLKTGRPQVRGAIVDYLREVGRPLKVKDPGQSVGTIMWRLRDQFQNVEGHGYWPTDVGLPDDIQEEQDKAAEWEEILK